MSVPIISAWRGQTDFALDLANYADLKPCARMAYGDFLFASLLDMRDRQYLWDQLLLARTDVQLADMLITLNPDLFARMAFTLMPTVLDQWLNAMGLTVGNYLSSVDGYVLFGGGYADLLKETLMGMGHASNGWRYAVAEHHLYGSSRVGLHQTQLQLRKPDLTVVYATVTAHVEFYRGKRNYELSNHLGKFNGCWFCEARPYSYESRERSDSGVQATISDKRRSVCNEELGIAYFEAEVLTQTVYYPFGMMMPDRQWSAGAEGYRYGFNGMERDDETYGKGNALDFGARIYDSRLGRWLSVDAMENKFIGFSGFNFAVNCPMLFIDPNGNRIELNGLTKSEKREYKASIRVFKKSELFKQMYKELEQSKTVINVNLSNPNSGKGGMVDRGDGTLGVTVIAGLEYTVAQEFFHAYQRIVENVDIASGSSTDYEVEGEVATFYIMAEVFRRTGKNKHIYSPIGGEEFNPKTKEVEYTVEIFKNHDPEKDSPTKPDSKTIDSKEYNDSYQSYKEKFVEYNKLTEKTHPGGIRLPKSYTGNFSDKKPDFIGRLVKQVEENKR